MPKGIEARLTLAVLAYAALQVVLRLLIGPALELDEAEAFYQSRHLALGYGPQPPLYFWLQWGLFRVLGEGLLALALLKEAILAGTVLGLFAMLRREAGAWPAAVAALSLSLLPQVVWEGQRALTHTMLALFMAVVATGLFGRALASGRWRDHLVLGLTLGLGALSKFNFVLWPLALLAAASLLPEWRGRLRPLRLGGAAAVAAVVVAPVAFWIARNPELATASVAKLDFARMDGVRARVEATRDLLMASLTLVALAVLVLGGFALARRGPGARLAPLARLIGAAAGLSLALLWLGLLASGATEIAVRWLLPVAWGLVPVAVLGIWPRLGDGARRGLGWTVAAIWLVVVPLLPYASLVDPGYRGADFGPLVERLQELTADEGRLLVEDQWVAGNLAFLAPDLAPRLIRPGDRAEPGAVVIREQGADGGVDPAPVGRDAGIVAIGHGGREVRVEITVEGP
ncbi:hypothetical protein Rumeso_04639 [Rubellimicrobium mesophilum DSM 19309]|uniref:Glycosyltransferase RgtA/B/C/D-like domain-containing protein n=1 Tax=Rubellimicrobium mesophilum DSM 19309 TaxID=442562 RepID=A0A017HH99_9RHOB|nr:glycosyltransferase family 39 protein [Rubellimicrobium mesophilum]EYD73518.1 hypothetical protein Rumeso_04639 [Rubellimicrobium mesophilum DSM 19309]